MAKKGQSGRVVRKIPKRRRVQTGKPRKIIAGSMRVAYGAGFGGAGSSGVLMGAGGNVYSPELSTDFLELPQSIDELRNYFRFFYRRDPFVGQAVDLHVTLPLSKTTISRPEAKSQELAEEATKAMVVWADEIGLLHRLMEIVHDYTLMGEVHVFCEDTSPDIPEHLLWETVRIVDDEGAHEEKIRRKDTEAEVAEWVKANYKGWTAIRVLPPEQVHIETFPFTDEKLMELVPDSKTRGVVAQAQQGDPRAQRVVDSMPKEIVERIIAGENIPLNTDPDAGSFVHTMSRQKSQYEARGHSVLERCLPTLVYRDKLRQAQTSIASRHMTPYRIVYAEDMSAEQTEDLRDQVDLALQDPDFSIVTNFPVEWDERGADGRLLDLSSEYDLTDRQLYAGLGVTEGLLTGESTYSGDRISLDVINTRFMLLRELLQDMVEKYFFKPMCRRMGFIEVDDDGRERVIYPRLSFTRLPLRDNQDTFDILFNLYQKGSLDIDVILEMLNIDPIRTREKLKRDAITLSDATFNEILRSAYSQAGSDLAQYSDLVKKAAEELDLKYEKPEEEGGGRW